MKARHLPFLVLPLVLAACGGSDSSDDSSTSSKSAETTAALTLSLLAASEAQSAASATQAASLQTKAFEDIDCQSGELGISTGTVTETGSPFTDAAYEVTSREADDCSFGYSVSTGRVSSQGTQTLDGALHFGTAADSAGEYAGILIGNAPNDPATLTLESSTTFSSASASRTIASSVEESLFVRIDRMEDAGDLFEQWTILQNASFGISGSNGFDRSGGYSLEMGTAAAPFIYASTNAGKTFDGTLSYQLSQDNIPDECADATIAIETVEPLIASGEEEVPYASGAMMLTDGEGATTEVVFNGDGSVTVSDEDSSQTLDYLPLLAIADECVAAVTAAAQARAAY